MKDQDMEDRLNPKFIHQGTATALLVRVAQGELNALTLVKEELANRGMDNSGEWVGFDRAAKIHAADLHITKDGDQITTVVIDPNE